MLISVLLTCIVVSTFVLAVWQVQRGDVSSVIATIMIGSSLLLIVAFFAMPWVSLQNSANLLDLALTSLLPEDILRQFETLGVTQELRRIGTEASRLTGWVLASEIPSVGAWMQFSLFTIPLIAISALTVSALTVLRHPLAQPGALFLAVVALLGSVLLFFSIRRVRTLGVDPGVFAPLIDIIGVRFGSGIWVALGSLATITISGVLLSTQPRSTKSPGGSRRRSPVRAAKRRY